MEDTKVLEQLQGVIPRLGIELKEVDGDFTGGLCCVKGRRVLLINSSLTTRKMIEIMCRELVRQDLSHIFILPAVRKKIEAYSMPSKEVASRESTSMGEPTQILSS